MIGLDGIGQRRARWRALQRSPRGRPPRSRRHVRGWAVDAIASATMLADQLRDDGVRHPGRSAHRSADHARGGRTRTRHGAATYRFYFDGTSAPELSLDALGDTAGRRRGFTGGLAWCCIRSPTSSSRWSRDCLATTLLLVDVNARPAVITDRAGVPARRCGAWSAGPMSSRSATRISRYSRPISTSSRSWPAGAQAVVVTAGSSSTQVVHRSGVRSIAVPPLAAPIVDTIGAGDTFVGAFMACWSTARLGRSRSGRTDGLEHVVRAVEMGHAAAGIVVTRHGADPDPTTC